jgi:hypothetical protein
MILLIEGLDGSEPTTRETLYNFCAELNQKGLLSGCLISYPQAPAERIWLTPFIHSLRSAGVQRVNLLITTAAFTADDLEGIAGMSICEIILLEDSFQTHFIDDPRVGVRVWLNWVDWGRNHKKACTWNTYVKNLLSIEKAPLSLPATEPRISIWNDTPLPENLLEQWRTKLPLRLIGDNADAGSLPDPPEWLFTPDKIPDEVADSRHFFDYIKDDVTKMTDYKRQNLKQEFLQRIHQHAQTNFQ